MESSSTFFDYSDSPYPIRAGLVNAHKEYWQTLAKAGSWFNGAERVAIADEVRNALQCPFCVERKNALSPYAMQGEHLTGDVLSDEIVDAVHRVVTDQSRITKSYVQDNVQKGFSEEQYVELVGIVVSVLSIDEFHRALGLPQEPLPQSVAGEPDHYRPAHTEHDTGYVAMILPEGAVGPESDLWPERSANVLRALSLVPDAVRSWMKIGNEQYLSMEAMGNFTGPNGRSINRMQIELVAGRVSSINECFY
jgi:alkylhydroperoxidase family enzyme